MRRLAEIASVLAIGIAIAIIPLTAYAAQHPSGDPKTVVEKNQKKLIEYAAKAKDQDELTKGMKKILAAMVDYELFAAKTLKSSWPTLSRADRDRFKTSFVKLVVKTYAKRFKPKTRFTVEYKAATKWLDATKTLAEVLTIVKGAKISVDVSYEFRPSTDGKGPVWRASDIIIDGVSMARNWRKPFTNIIKKKGFEELIRRIDKQVDKK